MTAFSGVFSSAQNPPIFPAGVDSIKLGTIPLAAYSTHDTAETTFFAPGDSIFLFDGELYFHARADGHDFFISRNEILKHTDSLVVYQTLRLAPATLAAAISDTASVKVERKRCTTITKNGTRCHRMALPGLDKCWQHKK
jgi:hypothetical protein